MIIAGTILDEASTLLLDTARRTWSLDDLLGYLNEALRATAGAKPDMYTVDSFITPAAGVLQALPSDGVVLINIQQNATGRVVTQVDEGLLDEANRFYPLATQQAEVEHYTYDPRNPRRYRLFPPNDGTGSIQILYGAIPPQVNYDTEEMQVSDMFQAPLLDYVLSRAYAKNSKKQDLSKSSYYKQQWATALGLKSQAQVAISPRVSQSPGE